MPGAPLSEAQSFPLVTLTRTLEHGKMERQFSTHGNFIEDPVDDETIESGSIF